MCPTQFKVPNFTITWKVQGKTQSKEKFLSSRVVHDNMVFASKQSWRDQSLDTSASCLALANCENDIPFANIVIFFHGTIYDGFLVLVEAMQTSDPFDDFAQSFRNCELSATLRALSAVHTIQRFNRFFTQVSGCELRMRYCS